jgi:hypothetical protein
MEDRPMTKEKSWKEVVGNSCYGSMPKWLDMLINEQTLQNIHDAAYQNGLDQGRIEVLEASEARHCTPPAPVFDGLGGR